MPQDYIDIYCERLEPGLWAEPLNAVTNLSFFVAALLAFTLAHRENALDWRSIILITLITVIGAGSTLFHTFATHWAMLTDTLPILFFQLAFLFFYGRGVMKLSWPGIAMLFCAFVLCIYGFGSLPSDWLNGSLSYAPAFLFLGGLGIWHWRHAKTEKYGLLAAAGVFAVSLTLRSLDMAACAVFPLGLHFFWHILNGFVLYTSARAYILNAGR